MRVQRSKVRLISWRGFFAAALPSFIMLTFFYSLAFHMYHRLGGWPTSIGEQGFPASLILHAHLTEFLFVVLSLFGMFVLPGVIVICLLRPRSRPLVRYLVLYALVFAVCCAVMGLAPAPFLDWWWD